MVRYDVSKDDEAKLDFEYYHIETLKSWSNPSDLASWIIKLFQ